MTSKSKLPLSEGLGCGVENGSRDELEFDLAWVNRPCLGEAVSGDVVVSVEEPDGLFLAMVDVLGHGPEAHEEALRIQDYLRRCAVPQVVGSIKGLDRFLSRSRGAAVGLAWIDRASGVLTYTGIGNTCLRVFQDRQTRLTSRDGIVGQLRSRPRTEQIRLTKGALLLAHTDGISERADLGNVADVRGAAVRFIADYLVRNFGKDHDDASCLAVRCS